MEKYISTYVAEFIAGIEITESKPAKCDCGETYALITDNDEYVVCDACADFYNRKKLIRKVVDILVSHDTESLKKTVQEFRKINSKNVKQ